ncbi:MAG: MamI family restriction endonuclease [Halobacteriales archaeon]|nr:MamI family restriction endonuclease [Halobacteriales archaeon]
MTKEMGTDFELVKECLHELFIEPRRNLYKWSQITQQTLQVRLGYPGEHLASVITGVAGAGTAARGDDLSDGTEVKSCSRADQLDECEECGQGVLKWQEECPECGSEDIEVKTDSHWIFSITSEKEMNLYLDEVPRVLLILFDRVDEGEDLRVRVWNVDTDQAYYRAFVRDYYENNYLVKKDRGKSPAPLNLHPEKYDFYMMEPELVFKAIMDIKEDEVSVKFWDLESPRREKMPTEYVTLEQLRELFTEEELRERIMELPQEERLEYLNSHDKSKVNKLQKKDYLGLFPYIPEEKRGELTMKDKTLRSYNEEYSR